MKHFTFPNVEKTRKHTRQKIPQPKVQDKVCYGGKGGIIFTILFINPVVATHQNYHSYMYFYDYYYDYYHYQMALYSTKC